MADRTSAALFASLFEKLSAGKTLDAEAIWEIAKGYDFAPQQMECNDALEKLGLAWICDGGGAPGSSCGMPCYGPDSPSKCEECGTIGSPFDMVREDGALDRPRGASTLMLWEDHQSGRSAVQVDVDQRDLYEAAAHIRRLESTLEAKGVKIRKPSIGMKDTP